MVARMGIAMFSAMRVGFRSDMADSFLLNPIHGTWDLKTRISEDNRKTGCLKDGDVRERDASVTATCFACYLCYTILEYGCMLMCNNFTQVQPCTAIPKVAGSSRFDGEGLLHVCDSLYDWFNRGT